ncbi:hypothetical protein V502_10890, partial [Pseudogymnoascus sp. VKM F-4520 (FW-2644)]
HRGEARKPTSTCYMSLKGATSSGGTGELYTLGDGAPGRYNLFAPRPTSKTSSAVAGEYCGYAFLFPDGGAELPEGPYDEAGLASSGKEDGFISSDSFLAYGASSRASSRRLGKLCIACATALPIMSLACWTSRTIVKAVLGVEQPAGFTVDGLVRAEESWSSRRSYTTYYKHFDTMSSRCVACDRYFDSDESLERHNQDSLAHVFDCTACDRHYNSETALQQHLRDSVAHALSYCSDCDRSFNSKQALQQHLRDSPAHTPSFDCETCDRHYGTETALQQHLRYSVAHAPSFDCGDCNRSFNSEQALQQHLQGSPAHAPSFNCETCDRHYSSETDLQQHLRDSVAHAPSFDCSDCDRSFDSEQALQQHLQDSPAHVPSFDCEICNRHYGSETALENHLRDSPIHQQNTDTPLDVFFRTFPMFDYNPSLPPATSYTNLQKHEGWRRGNAASDNAWDRYQDALQDELQMWYGAENDLTAWHALCRAIGVEPLPETCEQCEHAVRKIHVNIVDLIEWGRSGREEKVQTFRNVVELGAYTKETRKIFHNTSDQEGGNVVLRHLLRKIF